MNSAFIKTAAGLLSMELVAAQADNPSKLITLDLDVSRSGASSESLSLYSAGKYQTNFYSNA